MCLLSSLTSYETHILDDNLQACINTNAISSLILVSAGKLSETIYMLECAMVTE